jgi:hypothetical protein
VKLQTFVVAPDDSQTKPSLQSKFTLLQSKLFSRQNSLFQNINEKFGGKKIYFANTRGPFKKIHDRVEGSFDHFYYIMNKKFWPEEGT